MLLVLLFPSFLDFERTAYLNQLKKYKDRIDDLKGIIQNQDSTILRYENFVNDYDYAFQKIESFLDESLRKKI